LAVNIVLCIAAAIPKIDIAISIQKDIFDLVDILRFHTIIIGHKASTTSAKALNTTTGKV